MRQTSNGKAVASITIATTPRSYNKETKDWEDGVTVWTRASAFGNLAEHIGASLRKGSRVVVVGTLKSSVWRDKEGNERTSQELQIEDLGASLMFASVEIHKGDHSYTNQVAKADNDGWVTVDDDDTPF
jgi:single-strand DNA-binding protein